MSVMVSNTKDEDASTTPAIVQKSPVLSFEKKDLGARVGNRYRLDLSIKPGDVVNVWINDQPFISRIVSNSDKNAIEVPMQYGKNHLRILVLDGKQKIVYADEAIIDVHNSFLKNLNRSVETARTNENLIAFTFDGGSDDLHSQEILKILRDYKVHCTLFLTGKFMLRHPALVKQMIADGHEIGNHMFSHPHLTTYSTDGRQNTFAGVTREFVQQELLKTDSIFYKISGAHLQPFWRAPFGEYNQEILDWAAEIGYRHIRWTGGFDTYDWVTDESSKLFRTPGEIYSQFSQKQVMRSRGLKGVIVLMHLGSHRNNNHVYQVLPRLIEWIRGQNYQLATVTELLSNSSN